MESLEHKRQRARKILYILSKKYPGAKCSLYFKNNYQLLAAAMLSANCSDVQVNKVTPYLFKKYPTPEKLAKADITELQKTIKSIGLWRNKSRNLKKAAQILVSDHHSQVPDTMIDLMKLPGVGRKVANVVLSVGFGKIEGIALDTHNNRIANRLVLTQSANPKIIERNIMQLIPQKDWDMWSVDMIAHGRQICTARKPACNRCPVSKLCPSAFKFPHFSRKRH